MRTTEEQPQRGGVQTVVSWQDQAAGPTVEICMTSRGGRNRRGSMVMGLRLPGLLAPFALPQPGDHATHDQPDEDARKKQQERRHGNAPATGCPC